MSSIRAWNRELEGRVGRSPILTLPLFLLYLGLSYALCAAFALLMAITGAADSEAWHWAACAILALLWLHFLVLNFQAFRGNLIVRGNRRLIARVLQLYFSTTFAFAVGYYALQFFSANRALKGVAPLSASEDSGRATLMALLSTPPSVDTAVDCFYFSVVTITGLGYGDIAPLSAAAKLLAALEVLLGSVIVVLGLGSVIGSSCRPRESEDPAEPGISRGS